MKPAQPITSPREHLLIVGAGMAAHKLVEELLQLCPERFRITLVGQESHAPYNRVLLSSLLAGEAEEADLPLRPLDWYAAHGVELRVGVEVSALDPDRREARLSDGVRLQYDLLVLATGSDALRLPVPGGSSPDVLTFRGLDDVRTLRSLAAQSRAVVIGGGLLGIEAACGLAAQQHLVTLVHLMPRLMERQLDARAALFLKDAVERRGINVVLEAETTAIEHDFGTHRVVLKDGRAFPAEVVVMAAGIRPRIDIARRAGLDIGRAIKVDDNLETSRPGIYAIGECAEHCGACYGIVEPAHEQAKALAAHLAGGQKPYTGSLPATNLKVSGIPVYSMGDFEGEGAEIVTLEDEGGPTYRKLVIRDGRLAGVVLFGDTSEALWYRELVLRGTPLAKVRALLAFGKAYAEAA